MDRAEELKIEALREIASFLEYIDFSLNSIAGNLEKIVGDENKHI